MKILNIPELNFLKIAIEKHPNNNLQLEFLKKQNAVAAFILNETGENVLLVSQYRPGVKGYIYEVPAGLIEKDEDPLNTLFREVEEETGYLRKDYDLIYKSDSPLFLSPGYTTEALFTYILKLKSDKIVPIPLKLDENEELEGKWFKLNEIPNITYDFKTIFLYYFYKNLS